MKSPFNRQIPIYLRVNHRKSAIFAFKLIPWKSCSPSWNPPFSYGFFGFSLVLQACSKLSQWPARPGRRSSRCGNCWRSGSASNACAALCWRLWNGLRWGEPRGNFGKGWEKPWEMGRSDAESVRMLWKNEANMEIEDDLSHWAWDFQTENGNFSKQTLRFQMK